MAAEKSLHFLLSSLEFGSSALPSSSDTLSFLSKLQECMSKLNSRGFSWPAQFLQIANYTFRDIAVGPNHIAILLQDGRVARFSINIFADRLSSSRTEPSSRMGGKSCGSGSGGGGGAVLGSGAGSASVLAATRTAKIRRVMMAARSGRGGRGVIVGSRPLIPASAIPEDLIAQAQVVLQGKSRESIVRELQRTNLDVNLAVNNLLSREDEDGEDGEEGQDAYLPEELISLLDAGLQSGDHPNVILDADAFYSGDVFEYASAAARRRAAERAEKTVNERSIERTDATTTLRSFQPMNPVTPGCVLEFWSDEDGQPLVFSFLAALRSEAVAVGLEDGKLYSWPWDSEKPVRDKHPKSQKMGLGQQEEEWITQISATLCRCTILTNKNRVGSFMDAGLGVTVGEVLDVPLMDLSENPVEILTCPLFSCARTKGDAVYWWGVSPFSQRRKQWEKVKNKSRKRVTFDTNEIKEGSEVKMRSNPVYQVGALGFTTVNGYPQVGELMEAAWTLSETCRFRIKNEKDLRDEVFKGGRKVDEGATEERIPEEDVRNSFYEELRLRMKRTASQALKDDGTSHKEEAWSLKEVTFVKEGRLHDIGKVIMVDNAYCGVIFPSEGGQFPENDAEKLKAVRLMRKDELQVVSSGLAPRSPETIQRQPKHLDLPKNVSVLHLCVDSAGVRVLAEKQGKLVVGRCSLSGRMESVCELPVYSPAFRGSQLMNPRILNFGEEHISLLMDGNGCLLPLSKDSVGGFREPVPLMMGPVEKVAMGIHPLKPGGSGKVNKAAVTVLTVKVPTLMEHVLHCDLDSVKQFVSDLEKDKNLDKAQEEIVNARVDGNRTLLHAAIVFCGANKNKENADGTTSTGEAGSESNSAVSARSAYEARWEHMISGRRSGAHYNVSDMLEYTSRRFERGSSLRDSPIGDRMSPVLGSRALSLSDQPPAPPPMPSLRNHWPPSENPQQQALEPPPAPLAEPEMDSVHSGEGDRELADIPLPPMPPTPKTVSEPKERQGNALGILKFLCQHPFMTSYLLELLTTRDINGHTPFMSAVSIRAYSAAVTLWETAERLARATTQYSEALMQMIFPTDGRPDDSPLFVLCYNDTCSFTWTGDEHINQDIFECKTCALVGSLCCCTECAHVCHKNHDCKLKKTSPTAYCDCWERCKCKALISGNQTARFDLLNKLLNHTDLVTKTNKKGEHLMLFLARTVGRQAVEQRQHRPLRAASKQQQKTDTDLEMPEHDLAPPQFAKQALELLLKDWSAVKSMLLLGCKETDKTSMIEEDQFYLSAQQGVTYLDQLVNCLVGRCTQDLLTTLVSTLIREAQKPEPDSRVHEVIRRFTRSLVRVFVVCSICSSPTAGKRKNLHQSILKCRSAFEALISYSVLDLAYAADAILAPVRMGLLKSTQPFSLLNMSVDVVDIVEKLFAGSPVPLNDNLTEDENRTLEMEVEETPPTEPTLPPAQRLRDEPRQLNRDVEVGLVDPESDSESEPDISRTDSLSTGAMVRSEGYENLAAEADNSENSNLDDTQVRGNVGNADISSMISGISEPVYGVSEDSLDDVGRDVYYSDGESVDSGGSHHEDQDEPMDQEESGGEREGAEESSFSDAVREAEETVEDSGESESESDRNASSAEPAEQDVDFRQARTTRSGLRRQIEAEVYESLARTTASETTASSDTWSNRVPPPTLSWASRRHARDAVSTAQSLSAANNAATTATPQPTSTAAGTVPPPERGAGFIFLDTSVPPPTMRRSAAAAVSSFPAPGAPPPADSSATATAAKVQEVASLTCASALLSRAFGIVCRQIADLMLLMSDYKMLAPNLPMVLVMTPEEVAAVQDIVEVRLKPSWDWLFSVLDSVEGQLKFGSALATATDLSKYSPTPSATFSTETKPVTTTAATSSGGSARTTPSVSTTAQSTAGATRLVSSRVGAEAASSVHAPHVTYDPRRRVMLISHEPEQSHQSNARKEFVQYLLSLLRGHSGEHADDFPVLDVTSLRHVAYVADACLYYLEVIAKTQSSLQSEESDFYIENLENRILNSSCAPELKEELLETDAGGADKEKSDAKQVSPGKLRKFFQRSKSILYPGVSLRLGPFDHPPSVGLPLAEKPHLLRPDASKQKMFGLQSRLLNWNEHKEEASEYGLLHPTHLSLTQPGEEAERKRKPGTGVGEEKGSDEQKPGRPQSVIVHASRVTEGLMKPPDGVGALTMEELTGAAPSNSRGSLTTQKVLGRWKFALTVLAKVFSDEIGTEPGSILVQMAGFPVRESRFRKEMEKLRNGQRENKDDLILEVDRERHLLIQQTVKQLNQRFNRRMGSLSAAPLTLHKVKVTFKDEPGEGSGVARSFYAAIAEALLSPDRLPNLEHCQVPFTPMSPTRSPHSQVLMNRLRQRERQREVHRRRITRQSAGQRFPLSVDAPPFFVPGDSVGPPPPPNPPVSGAAGTVGSQLNWDPSKQTLGERLLPKVRGFRPTWANKVTGMLLELPAHQVVNLLTNDELLRGHVEDAVDMILTQQSTENAQQAAESDNSNDAPTFGISASGRAKKSVSTPNLLATEKGPVLDPDEMVDSAPLFFQPGKTGFYAPVPGKNSAERLNAFRNIGRLMGICLLQNEVLPLHLCRHVLKFVLGRPVTWYDLAFFDSALFESLRSLVQQKGDLMDLHLTFSVTLSQEEGGETVDLKPNGSSTPVTKENVIEYIYRYVDHRMITMALKPLEAIKQGVFDVLPSHSLEGLTAEDLRLLSCGTHDVSAKLLQSYTTFADESSASSEQLSKFKKWFWGVVEKMKNEERQDLVYFWTGSPALPSSEEGFQPLPSVMIRPADDHHLPTANTCISRLYVPLYSSKQVLKQKLLMAIKARNFGFV